LRTRRSDVEAWFDSEEVCDLHAVLTSQLVWPTEDVTLKTLAKYVRFMWRDEDPSGGNSIAWYRFLNVSGGNVSRGDSSKSLGFSVRCLRN